MYSKGKSVEDSGKIPTHPSPKLTFCPRQAVSDDAEFVEE